MQPEQLCEFVDSRGIALKVDRDKGILHGVKILGRTSKNGREYPQETIQRALPLYEGAKVNVNHAAQPTAPRGYEDRLGVIRNVRASEAGAFADFHFNPKHALAEQLLWDAEHAPENVGFSHNVEAKIARQKSGVVVEEILRVQSVDLVADPATTRGLFESSASEGEIADKMADDAKQAALRKINRTAEDLISSVMWGEEGAKLTVAQKKTRILTVLADWEKELTTLSPAGDPKGEPAMNEAELRSGHAQLVEQIESAAVKTYLEGEDAKKAAAETKQLREELDRYKAAEALAAKTAAVEKLLAEAKLPKEVVTDVFRGTLLEAKDEAAQKALIEDRKALAAKAGSGRPLSKESAALGESFQGPADAKGFVSAIAE